MNFYCNQFTAIEKCLKTNFSNKIVEISKKIDRLVDTEGIDFATGVFIIL